MRRNRCASWYVRRRNAVPQWQCMRRVRRFQCWSRSPERLPGFLYKLRIPFYGPPLPGCQNAPLSGPPVPRFRAGIHISQSGQMSHPCAWFSVLPYFIPSFLLFSGFHSLLKPILIVLWIPFPSQTGTYCSLDSISFSNR